MNEVEPKGCLAVILGFFGIRLSDPSKNEADFPYRMRDDFLSAAEFSFYRVLRLAVKDRAVILAKVNLADIFFVSRPNENQAYRNKIDRKHVDFLGCDPTTMKPLIDIELDDKSHNRQDRIKRDLFVEQVFQTAGLPLIRFPAKAAYDPNQLSAQLGSYLDGQERTAAAIPLVSMDHSPLCPKCRMPMVIRTVSKGEKAGKQFWGCSNYPKCREILN
jgi:hypothetical protein